MSTEYEFEEILDILKDLYLQADEDTPVHYRSQAFTDAIKDAEDLLIKHNVLTKG